MSGFLRSILALVTPAIVTIALLVSPAPLTGPDGSLPRSQGSGRAPAAAVSLDALAGPASPGRTGSSLERAGGDSWALVVGVSQYLYVDDLVYADDDALSLGATLGSMWGESHVKLLTNSQATRAGIQDAFAAWLDPLEDADDTVVFYFSGHGSFGDDESPMDEADGWEETILPYDARTTSAAYDICDDDLTDWLGDLECTRQVVILDSCFSGGFAENGERGGSAPSGADLSEGLSRDLARDGRVTLAACADYESSLENPFLEHGVFTYYILSAFDDLEAADADDNDEVSAEEIFDYAEPRTVYYEPEQHPVMTDGYAGDLAMFGTCTITIDASPRVSPVTLDGEDHSAEDLPLSVKVIDGTSHTLSVPAAMETGAWQRRYAFTSWNDGAASNSRTVTAGAAASYVAAYETQCHLAVVSEHGQQQGSGWYAEGGEAAFSVEAVAGEGDGTRYIFAGWGGAASGTANPASIVMDSPKTVTAAWRSQCRLTLSSHPSAAATLDGDGWFDQGTVVSTRTAFEEADSSEGTRYVLSSCTVDGVRSSIIPASIAMSAPHTVVAQYSMQYELTVVSERGDPKGSGWYDSGSAAGISVTSPQGAIVRQVFAGWSGCSSSAERETAVIMDGPKTVEARWRTDYTQLYALVAGIVVLIMIATGAVLLLRRVLHPRAVGGPPPDPPAP